jgi:hypothetical protein
MPKQPKPVTQQEKANMTKPCIDQKCPYSIKLIPGK